MNLVNDQSKDPSEIPLESKKKAIGMDKWSKASILASFASAAATIVLALLAYGQLSAMHDTLDLMWQNLRVSQRPELHLSVAPQPGPTSTVLMERPGEGGERWTMPYFVVNTGTRPAYKLRYYHIISEDTSFSTPSQSAIGARHAANMISPGDVIECGYDELYRQVVLDKQKENRTYIRHLYVIYEDEFGNEYSHRASWRLDYQLGRSIEWALFAKRDLTDYTNSKRN